jgi:class 3 adenylate cyclase
MDVAAWLRGLGLEQYAQLFRDNDIDGEILCGMTDDDLKELGISSFGHRRRLLNAITALGGQPSTRNVAQSATSVTFAPTSPPPIDAERRQLTVMFCDLVGSTALSARLDPEDLREVVAAYHRAVADVVRSFDGFVAKYMGDGVLAYFGYPRAHEDDAERAVRAGLGLIDAVSRLDTKSVRLQTRVAIATGLVVVGDLIGEGSAQEQSVVGETPNLAARLQALAEADCLIVADSTRRQLGGLFEVEDLGQQPLAGFAAPQRTWRVVGESGVLSRFEALRAAALTRLVGRDEELDLLLRRWQQAKSGEGRAVLIGGEPGIGKSRLTAELAERIKSEPHTRLRYFCSPHHQDSALYPFIAQLERAAGFARVDTAEQRLDKLQALLARGAHDADEIALLAELLSLPSSAADLNLSPQKKREKLLEALLHQLEALAREKPVLMLFEDVHWIDPTSRELLDLTVERARGVPVLLVITFRPEFQPPWSDQPHVTTLALTRLGERDGAALVQQLAGNRPLADEMVDEIVARTDGVPLFVEELAKAVIEEASQQDCVAAVLQGSPAPAVAVPATLQASLIARFDRLGTAAKEVAQIGAVLGREFGYELIEPVAGRSDLDAALGRLAAAGLLFCRGVPPQSSYLFKHALVQEAAYSTLLRGRRQELHARAAAVLEQRFGDLVERQPELLAHHLAAAGDLERAVDQWLTAGRHAASRSAHPEAIGHFERGLTALGSLPQTQGRDGREVELQLARGISLLTAKGFDSPEAIEPFTRARDLSEKNGDADRHFVATWNVWLTAINSPDAARQNAAGALSDRLLTLARRQPNSAQLLEAHHTAWATHGEPMAAHSHCEEGRRIYDFGQHRSLATMYGGHDPGCCACQFASWSEWLLGYPDRAVESINEGHRLAERLAEPLTLNQNLLFEAALRLSRGEPDLALRRAREAGAQAVDQRLAPPLEPEILAAGALAGQGAVADALSLLDKNSATRAALRANYTPLQMAVAADVLCRAGDYDGAAAALAEAAAPHAGVGLWWAAEVRRLKGVLLLARGSLAESEACFRKAIAIAQRQQAKSLELRAATSLARLWGEGGRRAEAHGLLSPVYGWFTEGFGTADLKEARALLDELG